MKDKIKRIFVEKKTGFDIEAKKLLREIIDILNINSLKNVRILNRYDIQNISEEIFENSKNLIFSYPPIDKVYEENLNMSEDEYIIPIEFLPGQYDQRADSAMQCLQILTGEDITEIKVAKIIVLKGNLDEDDVKKIKNYCINPVESHEAKLEKPKKLDRDVIYPEDVETIKEFNELDVNEIKSFIRKFGLAMSIEDLKFCQKYFIKEEKHPTITELKLIDTYWSDHCRHTTFLTKINNIEIQEGYYKKPIEKAYENYLNSRSLVYKNKDKDICLMDIATIAMKELRKKGKLDDLEVSDEINACSIVIDVDVNGENEEWLLMFKNETHNHPTEIEPYGGAATCLGGAIRDPLSGRSYVYQAMRVTGCGDPTKNIDNTIAGKLPQRKITIGAAEGYSSYGNQIGLSTGQVAEIYDEGYIAKRMEIGAVVGAVPKRFVKREKPNKGDIIILLGGRTGRDGCGGATGSSKEHTEESLESCGAEVQKGNAPTERKIQRFFRKESISLMIKKCNDFGAGGVSVAIGELADSLNIYLDKVPKKYDGLDGTELAISESQERMAVVLDKKDVEKFKDEAKIENLEATVVAEVTDTGRLKMFWKDKPIVNIKRSFLETNGAKQFIDINIKLPDEKTKYFENTKKVERKDLRDIWIKTLQSLNVCSQKGLIEMFDSSIGASTVLMPFGGKYQLSPEEGMVAKIPVLKKETTTASLMTYGFNPKISRWSPFHGAVYAVVESIAKIVSMGGDYKKVRLTLQEYFEKLGKDSEKWGKPLSALLGAYFMQNKLEIPAIGGKDSMSGTFMDLNVPPTLVSFAVTTMNSEKTVSAEFKKRDSLVCVVFLDRDEYDLPDINKLELNYTRIKKLCDLEVVLSARTIRDGGISESISKMCFGNKIGFEFNKGIEYNELFLPEYGSIILELENTVDLDWAFAKINYIHLGNTNSSLDISIDGLKLNLDDLTSKWEKPLEGVFPTMENNRDKAFEYKSTINEKIYKSKINYAKPNVLIPIFPGTNCEYDTEYAFKKAGGNTDSFVFRNYDNNAIEESIREIVKRIKKSQIIMIPGGFSLGDEPDGSGKFIATVFRNPYIKEAVTEFLEVNDGLILGICNGFQALVKLGLLPYGKILDIDDNSPVLTFNSIGRHVSSMVRTKIVSNNSPWLTFSNVGDIHTIPISHGEGRFVAQKELLQLLEKDGQIATQYVDYNGKPTYDSRFNPNGSIDAIEGILSPNGKVFGKMGHSERIGKNVAKNICGNKSQEIFKSGIEYFN